MIQLIDYKIKIVIQSEQDIPYNVTVKKSL